MTDGPENKALYDWTKDGREVVFGRQNKGAGWDIYAALIHGDHKTRPLVEAPFNQTDACVSPDVKWLAYVSDESGRPEVYVRAFPAVTTARWQVSATGGTLPVWAHSGKELV